MAGAARYRDRMLTYAEVGATRGGPLPPGYAHLRVPTRLPEGSFAAAAEAVLTWRMHRAAGVAIRASADRAAPGVRLHCGLGVGPAKLWAPCEVVWAVSEADRAGFAYGTLPGHPECGEEAFLVTREPDGTVRLTVTAFSRPASWLTRIPGPLIPPLQRLYARNCGWALRRVCRR